MPKNPGTRKPPVPQPRDPRDEDETPEPEPINHLTDPKPNLKPKLHPHDPDNDGTDNNGTDNHQTDNNEPDGNNPVNHFTGPVHSNTGQPTGHSGESDNEATDPEHPENHNPGGGQGIRKPTQGPIKTLAQVLNERDDDVNIENLDLGGINPTDEVELQLTSEQFEEREKKVEEAINAEITKAKEVLIGRRRGGILETDEDTQKAIGAAAKYIAASRWKDKALTGIKILCSVAGVAIVLVTSHGAALGLVAIPAVVPGGLKMSLKMMGKIASWMLGTRKMYDNLSKTLREQGNTEMARLGYEKMSKEDKEEYRRFMAMVADRQNS